jgi:hypothetical protein
MMPSLILNLDGSLSGRSVFRAATSTGVGYGRSILLIFLINREKLIVLSKPTTQLKNPESQTQRNPTN